MTSRDPAMKFVSMGVSVGMRALCGGCSLRDRLTLAMAFVELCPSNQELGAMLVRFHRDAELDSAAAGRELRDDLLNWMKPDPDIEEVPVFEWQNRADLQ